MEDILLLSGNDIPFISANVTIHQPTIKEIGYIGEDAFFSGRELLNFSKNILSEEDKNNLESYTDFDILIAILKEQNAVMRKNRNCVEMFLALIFPNYEIDIGGKNILLKDRENNEEHIINNKNYGEFKSIINAMFMYEQSDDQKVNPSGELAKKIAEKLRQRHERLAKEKGEANKKIDVLSRYVSILSVGEQKDMNMLLGYTVYQLFDEFKRYELKLGYDLYVKAKMAGARDLKEVEDWMKDIHSK